MNLEIHIEKNISSFNLKVDFKQNSGIVGFLGASGSGKSMTLKCIAGLVTPDKGKIILNDKILFDSDKKINLPPQKRKIGYVFQNYALFPNMTVEENISAGIFNLDKQTQNELCKFYIDKFKLTGLEKNYPHELSGGQSQRVALARALITSPDILLLDEPFSALDVYLKTNIEKDILEILKGFKGIVIYVTHDISEAFRICDDIITYDTGIAYNKKSKHDLFNNPENITEATLTGCNNIFNAQATTTNSVYCTDLGYEFNVNKNLENININYLCIRSHNLSIKHKQDINCYEFKIVNIIENPFSYKLILKNPNDSFTATVEMDIEKNNISYNLNDIIYIEFDSNHIFLF